MADRANGARLSHRGCRARRERACDRLGGGGGPDRKGLRGPVSRARLALRAAGAADARGPERAMTAALRPAQPMATAARPWAGARRFLAWWSDELSDLAAARASPARGWRVLLLRGEHGCDVYLRTRDRIEH